MIRFNNPHNQLQFERDGYVCFDLLSAEELEQLSAVYTNLKNKHTNPDTTLFSSLDNDNIDLTLEVEDAIQKVCVQKLSMHLSDFDYLFSTFLIKKSSSDNPTPYHQDPTLVENASFSSANIWIPLEDTAPDKGSLMFVPGSHRIVQSLVVTPDFYPYYHQFSDKLRAYSTEIKLKKGQAVLFNNKLVHGSNPNTSGKDRIAAVLSVKSKASKWCYYYMNSKEKEGEVEKYTLNKEHYSRIKKNAKPDQYESFETFYFKFPEISFGTFNLLMFKKYPKLALKGLLKSVFK